MVYLNNVGVNKRPTVRNTYEEQQFCENQPVIFIC